MAVGDNASQIPAVVRHIRDQKGATWKDKVRAWQTQHNANLPKGAPKLQVDGIVGRHTINAMKNSDPKDSDQIYKVNTRDMGSTQHWTQKQRRKEEAHNSGAQLASDVKETTRKRQYAANRNINYATPGEKTETLYERMKGDKGWAARYRAELKENRDNPKPVSNQKGSGNANPVMQSGQGRSYKVQAATLRNLRPDERAEFARRYQQSVVTSKPKKK